MNSYTPILRILAILTLFITIGWYGNLSHIRKDKNMLSREYKMTYDEAHAKLVHPVYRGNKYFYKHVVITTYSRTLIPFKYKKGTTRTENQYYSSGPNQ